MHIHTLSKVPGFDSEAVAFQWATHFNAHAHKWTIQTTPILIDVFQWATQFNAHAHYSGLRLNGRRAKLEFQWATQFQRPRTQYNNCQEIAEVEKDWFQWATQFNATHTRKDDGQSGELLEFQGATQLNVHAHLHGQSFPWFSCWGFNGLLTSTPTHTTATIDYEKACNDWFQWATQFNAHAHSIM